VLVTLPSFRETIGAVSGGLGMTAAAYGGYSGFLP